MENFTAQEIKNAQINAMIRARFAQNVGDIEEAVNVVMGAGAYRKVAGEVYRTLRNG